MPERSRTTTGIATNILKKKTTNTKEGRRPKKSVTNPSLVKVDQFPLPRLFNQSQYNNGEVKEIKGCLFDFPMSSKKLKQRRTLEDLEADALLNSQSFFPSQAWHKYCDE